MKGTWLRILGLLTFVVVIAGVGGWWMMRGTTGQSRVAASPEPEAQETTPAAPEPSPLLKIDRNKLVLPGVIEPYESVPVSAKLTANIASLRVRDGSTVEKGQLLCVLDDTEIRQQIDSARLICMQAEETLRRARETRAAEDKRERLALSTAQQELASYRTESQLQLEQLRAALKRAEKELADYEALCEAKAVSTDQVREKREAVEDAKRTLEQREAMIEAGLSSREQRVEQAQLDIQTESVSEQEIEAHELAVANAKAELDEREGRLADTRVTAPISGTVRIIPRSRTSAMMVTGKSAEVLGPGVRVYEGDPFLEIAATDRACVRIEVDETDIGRMHVGMKAKITGDAFRDRELQGEVAEIQIAGRRAGQGVSLFPVTVLITSAMEGVRMGMTADVTIWLASEEDGEQGG
jgi:multidrug efflux pump subunit AcrA (membrane-fusion protein)